MSFNIKLQRNDSEKNRVTKSITDIVTLSGSLREATSIIDPVIKVSANLADIADCNYLTIDAFNRSYFVTNMRTVVSGIIEISCHVDVLSSFADEIKDCTAILRRSESVWNLYLNDGSFRVYQNPTIVTVPFPTGFTTQQYILAVAGG